MPLHNIPKIGLVAAAVLVGFAANISADEEKTKKPAYKDFDFSFSPDGRKAVFYTYRDSKLPDILVRDHAAREHNLTNRADTWDIEPDFSPDGSKIIYSSGIDMASLSLRIMNADGTNDRVFFDGEDNEVAANWSPDGLKVMFSAFNNNERTNKIYMADSNGKNVHVLTDDLPGESSNASWSADGQTILFANRPNEKTQRDIYVMNHDGSNRKRLTNDAMSQTAPVYSPDGTHIIFVGQTDDGFSNLYSMPADGLHHGRRPRQLTNVPDSYQYFLSFKPGTNQLAFSQGDWEKGFALTTINIGH